MVALSSYLALCVFLLTCLIWSPLVFRELSCDVCKLWLHAEIPAQGQVRGTRCACESLYRLINTLAQDTPWINLYNNPY